VSICDGVIHLAAVLGTQETIEEPGIAFEVNVRGSINVFQAVRHYQLPAVYITVGNYWMNNPYSISKHTAERLALMFNRECGTRIAVVRGYNAYGPGQKAAPVHKIIPNFIIPALKGEDLIVYGDGSQVMDMIYVEDVAEILVSALLSESADYQQVLEAGTGRPTTVNQIAQIITEKVGRGFIKNVPMRPGEPDKSVVLAKVRPYDFVNLEDGLDRTIPYYAEALKTADYI
jgi:nucleoside-diphosphate-sugar epimerase